MKKIKINLEKYKKEQKSTSYEWQQYVLDVIRDFGIIEKYQKPIWAKAKKNMSYFRGVVENLRETKSKEEIKKCGALLNWLLHKKNT